MSDYTTPKGDEYLNFIGVGGSPADSDVFDVALDDLRHIKKFGEAFREARKRGLKVFKWGKSTYTTELAQEPKKLPKKDFKLTTITTPQLETPKLQDLIKKIDMPTPEGMYVIDKGWSIPRYSFPNREIYNYELFKRGGNITKHQQGGQTPQLNLQQQVIQLVQTAMDLQNPNSAKAMETINQIMEAAKAGDEKSIQIAQMIQLVIKLMQGQATSAKWGSKLQYMRSLKYAKGGKTCPACMQEGGQTEKTKEAEKNKKVKVAYKDIDKDTYQKLTNEQKDESDMHMLTYRISNNQDGSYNISHNPSSKDSTLISRSIMSKKMSRQYPEKKKCGGQANKRYFGGWL